MNTFPDQLLSLQSELVVLSLTLSEHANALRRLSSRADKLSDRIGVLKESLRSPENQSGQPESHSLPQRD